MTIYEGEKARRRRRRRRRFRALVTLNDFDKIVYAFLYSL